MTVSSAPTLDVVFSCTGTAADFAAVAVTHAVLVETGSTTLVEGHAFRRSALVRTVVESRTHDADPQHSITIKFADPAIADLVLEGNAEVTFHLADSSAT
jgi:hypothetical protein